MKTGREDENQLLVPETLRLAVPAHYGVELVKAYGDGEDVRLIISDQITNKHVDSSYHESYSTMCIDALKERIVAPMVHMLRTHKAIKVA